jgi:starch phosphorylase
VLRSFDPELWNLVDGDALRFINELADARIELGFSDARTFAAIEQAVEARSRYLSDPRWFQRRGESPLRSVAYFSPEFGISASLPQYSGGLGILAGDHLKSASDLGVPLIAVGLFYHEGYFSQGVDPDGHQRETYPHYRGNELELARAGEPFTFAIGDTEATILIWKASIGRVSLYLLDTNHPDNPPEIRSITDRLYGGDREHRLRQEIVLGMGGVSALALLGIDPQIFHSNEGHAGFLNLGRIEMLVRRGIPFDQAVQAVRASTLFTTHTTVDAGIDRFPIELVRDYLSPWAQRNGFDLDTIIDFGRSPNAEEQSLFNMAALSLHLSARANAVSREHQGSSQALFQPLWPGQPVDQVPIDYVTNGVHAPTWVGRHARRFYTERLGTHWVDGDQGAWSLLRQVDDADLWAMRSKAKASALPQIQYRLRRALIRSGWALEDLQWTLPTLDPSALTIGFSRRFATYKRANLLLRQSDRLRTLLEDPQRKIQFIFAGKAHPQDEPGKAMIREVIEFSQTLRGRLAFVFVPDYDMALASQIYQASDVWLNTPIYPLEASGTSGMKAALNGSLNLSIADGWWAECYDGTNGWVIDRLADDHGDSDLRDDHDVEALFAILERSVIPEFYDRGLSGIPHQFIGRIKSSLTSLGPFVTSHRMVKDYVTRLYEPLAHGVTTSS